MGGRLERVQLALDCNELWNYTVESRILICLRRNCRFLKDNEELVDFLKKSLILYY